MEANPDPLADPKRLAEAEANLLGGIEANINAAAAADGAVVAAAAAAFECCMSVQGGEKALLSGGIWTLSICSCPWQNNAPSMTVSRRGGTEGSRPSSG